MIVLFTDFGSRDSYVGQIHAILAQQAPDVPVIDLFHHVPNFDIRAAAYLLPSFISIFPKDSVFLCVVDPGVGGKRRPVFLRVDGSWFVGPDNGLFCMLVRRAERVESFSLDWRPATLSASFHGRDLFAPVAAMLACGKQPDGKLIKSIAADDSRWPDDLAAVIHIDHYGNAITGYRAAFLDQNSKISIHGHLLQRANTFSAVPKGTAFWFENANGLVELAVNQGRCVDLLSIKHGDSFSVQS